MTGRISRAALVAALLLAPAALSGCLLVAAGAGAAGAVAWTQRGVRSLADGSVDDVFARSDAVFRAMGIERTGDATADNGRRRTLTGERGSLVVTVQMERESASSTRVEVQARHSPVDYDREMARDVLLRIVQTR